MVAPLIPEEKMSHLIGGEDFANKAERINLRMGAASLKCLLPILIKSASKLPK